jgi:integrase
VRHVRSLGLPRIRFHDLRHTHASIALQASVHPKVVQERLGHSSVKLTLDTYAHVIPPMHWDAAARIASIVDDG